MPDPFEIVSRQRPVSLISPSSERVLDPAAVSPLPQPAPYAALVGSPGTGDASLTWSAGDTTLTGWYDDTTGRIGLRVSAAGRTSEHRSRRFGRLRERPPELALTLTGTHLSVLARTDGSWQARGRVELAPYVDVRDVELCAALHGSATGMASLAGGGFGQLGLRDLRFATAADGTPVRHDGALVLTATHAGPGFFDTAHTGVWSLHPETHALTHLADLFFERPDRPGAFGDHSTHLVRDGDRWLVATSTWGDFDAHARAGSVAARHGRRDRVEVTLASSDADLLAGRHRLPTRPLALPTGSLRSVGVWDPHLVRIDGEWWVAFVSARRFFRFHPVLAAGPSLDGLTLRGAATERIATEGATLVDLGDGWRLVASDGRDGRRGQRRGFPVWDLALREAGALDAPYPTNIPWPNLARLDDGRWLMATFNGAPAGGPLTGYGTHGEVLVLLSR